MDLFYAVPQSLNDATSLVTQLAVSGLGACAFGYVLTTQP